MTTLVTELNAKVTPEKAEYTEDLLYPVASRSTHDCRENHD